MPRLSLQASLLTALLMASAGAARAQQTVDPSAGVRLEAECRLAAQVLETGHPAPKYDWALNAIARCPGEGGRALAKAWQAAPADSARLLRLVYESSALADRRTLDAVLGAASDATRPRLVRFLALTVVATYVDPDAAVELRHLDDPDGGVLGVRMDAHQRVGAEPITAADRARAVDRVRALGDSDPDPRVRAAAGVLARELDIRLAHVHRQNDCRLAAQVLATGHPAPRAEWARQTIFSCPGTTSGPALASVFRRQAASRDTAALVQSVYASHYVRDGALFAAALDMAHDDGATDEARAAGLLTAMVMLAPQSAVHWGDLAGAAEEGWCPVGYLTEPRSQTRGAPLPADAQERVVAAAAAVRAEPGRSPTVRAAARCAAQVATSPWATP